MSHSIVHLSKGCAPPNQARPGERRLESRRRWKEREPRGLASVLGRQALPTQACHLPQAGERILQAAALLGTGPTAPQRLLHLGLVHVQQCVQRELSEDLLRKQRGQQRARERSGCPSTLLILPLARAGPPAEWQGPAAAGLASDLSHHLSEDSGGQLLPPPTALLERAAEVEMPKLQGRGWKEGRKKS